MADDTHNIVKDDGIYSEKGTVTQLQGNKYHIPGANPSDVMQGAPIF
jgi:hypothetical protein